jgi:hypothetical protein
MPPLPPRWDSKNPRGSLLALAEFLHEQARDTFLRDGTHVEILFLLADNGTIQPQPIVKPMTREHVARCLREQIPSSNIYGLIHIAEAWSYTAKGPDDHTLKQVAWGEMRVADLTDDDKAEVLMLSLLSRDGDDLAWVDRVVRTPPGTVSLEETRRLIDSGSPFGNVFQR